MGVFRRSSSGVPTGDAIPFEHQGTTHLFFLSSPPDTLDYPDRVRTTWQHVASEDLATWRELPPALEPGPPGSVDGDGVWTGSVIERDGTFHLFYTGHRVGVRNPQSICLATSTDLVTFTKHEGNPILLPPPGCEPVDWRDPYVFFNEAESRYWMVIAARLAEGPRWRRGCLMLATFDDLLTWTVEQEPLYVPGSTYCPECPEMWELDGRWYLVYSRFSEHVGTIYRVADDPRGPFRAPADDELGGRRWYAAKSAPSRDRNGRVFFGWVHDRAATGRWCWGGDFAAPREVRADGDGMLHVRLAESVARRFDRPVPLDGADTATITLDAVGSSADHILTPATVPSAYLVRCAFSGDDSPAAFGLMLRTDADLAGWYVTFDRIRGSVHLSRSPYPLDDFWADLVGRGAERREVDGALAAEARVALAEGPVRAECAILVDGSVVEVYVNDEVVLTHRIDDSGDDELGLFVVDGAVTCQVSLASADQEW
ncbi:family 43 glycosylhydrolase [Sphaerisporangium viridialbum]|uniref:family 43 glycosylhydrolase n=1 Tax=Sphaerisporangium viridialbum TaxID=46189 RepID=UPI003C7236E1